MTQQISDLVLLRLGKASIPAKRPDIGGPGKYEPLRGREDSVVLSEDRGKNWETHIAKLRHH